MNLLAIDSASPLLSIAASHGESIEYEEIEAGMKQSELIMSCIDKLVKRCGLMPKDLNGVVCMGGPGSFTGLRLGFSIAKGLALALDIPFSAVSTLECMAKNRDGLSLPVIQSVKGSYFYAFFRNGVRLTADAEAPIDQFSETIKEFNKKNEKIAIIGPGSDLILNALSCGLKTEAFAAADGAKGFAKELIFIAKNEDIFHNESILFSGPEYIRKGI